MQVVPTAVYTAQIERALATQIAELQKRPRGAQRGPTEPVGFTNSDIRKAVLNALQALRPTATNVPAGPEQKAERIDIGAKRRSAESVTEELEKIYTKQAGTTGSISITVIGEAHKNLDGTETADQDRGRALLQQMINNGRLAATSIVVLERDMELYYKPYPQPFAPSSVLESDIPRTGAGTLEQGLDREQRDLVLAGYLFLVLAGGDQSTVERVVVFRGSLHTTFLDSFEYFAKTAATVTGIDWVSRRPRRLGKVDPLQ
jgi:hypothetical protein